MEQRLAAGPPPRMPRRVVLRAVGAAALGSGLRRSVGSVRAAVGKGWTHLAGGGGSVFFYDDKSGAALAGTLDENGFTPGGQDGLLFPKGARVVIATATASGSLLLLFKQGRGTAGTLRGGEWAFTNEYRGFAGWTGAGAAGDSVLLYNRFDGRAAAGTLVDGAWTFSQAYRNLGKGFVGFGGSSDSLLLYRRSRDPTGRAGTLTGGLWSQTRDYENEFGRAGFVTGGYRVVVGSGDSLLLVEQVEDNDGTPGIAGRLVDGLWVQDNAYVDFAGWSHGAAAGNGFVLLYDRDTGRAAWGTLAGGAWTFFGLT